MTTTTLPFGTAMALAERNLRQPLVRILAEEQLAANEWFTINALGLRGAMPRVVLKDLLSTNGNDAADVEVLLSGLATDALVEDGDDGRLRLTSGGRQRFDSISDRVAAVTGRIFGLFDASQVEATRALLQQIAEVDPETIERVAFQESAQ